MFDYTIPVWHPIAVHFPIALLLVAAGAALVWAVRGTDFWRGALLALLALGTVGAFVARLTGEAMEEQSEGVPIVEALVEQHETGATWTLVLAATATLALVGVLVAERRGRPSGAVARWGVALLAVAAAVAVGWTGHLGGLMVWGVPAG